MAITEFSNYTSSLNTLISDVSGLASKATSSSSKEFGLCISDNVNNIWFIEPNLTKNLSGGDLKIDGPCIHLYFTKPTVPDANIICNNLSLWDGSAASLLSHCAWLNSNKLRKCEIIGDFDPTVSAPFTMSGAIQAETTNPGDDYSMTAFPASIGAKISILVTFLLSKTIKFLQAHGAASVLSR